MASYMPLSFSDFRMEILFLYLLLLPETFRAKRSDTCASILRPFAECTSPQPLRYHRSWNCGLHIFLYLDLPELDRKPRRQNQYTASHYFLCLSTGHQILGNYARTLLHRFGRAEIVGTYQVKGFLEKVLAVFGRWNNYLCRRIFTSLAVLHSPHDQYAGIVAG